MVWYLITYEFLKEHAPWDLENISFLGIGVSVEEGVGKNEKSSGKTVISKGFDQPLAFRCGPPRKLIWYLS